MSETTNSRVAWFSIMSLGVCLCVAGSQIWYLKRYFHKKKLILKLGLKNLLYRVTHPPTSKRGEKQSQLVLNGRTYFLFFSFISVERYIGS